MATKSGANITISIKDKQLVQQLDAAQRLDTTPLMGRLGAYFQKSTRDRFSTQTDPQGREWSSYAPLSPGYIKQKKQNKDKILTLAGRLRSWIRHGQPTAYDVAWGTNSPYAAIHQFGGTIMQAPQSRLTRFRTVGGQNQFAKKRHKRGVTEQWVERGAYEVNIPARPFLGVSDADNKEVLETIQDWYHRRLNGLPD